MYQCFKINSAHISDFPIVFVDMFSKKTSQSEIHLICESILLVPKANDNVVEWPIRLLDSQINIAKQYSAPISHRETLQGFELADELIAPASFIYKTFLLTLRRVLHSYTTKYYPENYSEIIRDYELVKLELVEFFANATSNQSSKILEKLNPERLEKALKKEGFCTTNITSFIEWAKNSEDILNNQIESIQKSINESI